MSDEAMYQILSHLDEPKRIIGLTLDDCIIGALNVFFVRKNCSGTSWNSGERQGSSA